MPLSGEAMRRREFITLIVGAAVVWPLTASAQQGERVRRIGVLLGGAEDDEEFQTRMAVFREELQRLGWTEDRNVRIDIRSAAVGAQAQAQAKELVASLPDVIVAAAGSPGVIALQQVTQTIPVVFVNVTDPVGLGVVTSLSRPSGNMTGFMPFEYGHQREMAGVAQANRPARQSRGSAARSHQSHRNWIP